MVKITDDWKEKRQDFERAKVKLPRFDEEEMRENTKNTPIWVHLGGGNLYRCFHAKVAQDLLNQGELQSGVIVFDTFGQTLIEQAYQKNKNRTLSVVMKSDGTVEKELITSTAEAYYLHKEQKHSLSRMEEVFKSHTLQLVTVTITEKGYAVKDLSGELTTPALSDVKNGASFDGLQTTMGQLCYLLYVRFQNGQTPISLVSTDNFSHNGERFKESILTIARGWASFHKVEREFVDWLENEENVAFPFSMIDRITPLPSEKIAEELEHGGITGMKFPQNSSFASFVNTEEVSYLVIEDNFPNGRPPLEKAGVYMTDREDVNKADLMKVCSCLNPLHTALAIFGCLLGFERIYQEMEDDDLRSLVEKIGYQEGLPVVVEPKILQPRAFLEEVLTIRFVNSNIPDSPQRIASDTSQKIGIRFGETIQAYMKSETLDICDLRFIPLTIAAWLRYLLAIDDEGKPFIPSSDPLLEELQGYLKEVKLKSESNAREVLHDILSNERIFSVNLYEAGLAERIEEFFVRMIQDVGSVRKVLQEELSK